MFLLKRSFFVIMGKFFLPIGNFFFFVLSEKMCRGCFFNVTIKVVTSVVAQSAFGTFFPSIL